MNHRSRRERLEGAMGALGVLFRRLPINMSVFYVWYMGKSRESVPELVIMDRNMK